MAPAPRQPPSAFRPNGHGKSPLGSVLLIGFPAAYAYGILVESTSGSTVTNAPVAES